MAITESNRDYEILIRINSDGSLGAHLQTISEILKDGVVINSIIDSPIPLQTSGSTGVLLSDRLGDIAALALVQLAEANAAIKALQLQLEEMLANTGELQAQLDASRQTSEVAPPEASE